MIQDTLVRRNVFVSLNGDPLYRVFSVESADPNWQRTLADRILELIGPDLFEAFERRKQPSNQSRRKVK